MKYKKPLSIIVLFVGCMVWIHSCMTTIDISKYATPTFYKTNYPEGNNVNFSLSIIETGFAKTLEAFVFRGGSLFKTRKLSHVSILIQHPKGTFVFDTGLGSNIEKQFHDKFSFLDRQMFKFTRLTSLKETLVENKFNLNKIDFIIPSHLHFDHASGIEDFSDSKVWTTKEEYDHAFGHNAKLPAFIKEQYDAAFIKWKLITFKNKPYEIFEESFDVFKDGTVVLVKLYGHTEGSLGMFVNFDAEKRYFFTGDLTWAAEAFTIPSEKHAIPRNKVDGNREKVKALIVKIHHLAKEKPEIKIVPAHDFNAQKDIAHFPRVEH